MSAADTLTIMSICAIVGTGINVYLSLRIANSVTTVKLWVRENFIAKDEAWRYDLRSKI